MRIVLWTVTFLRIALIPVFVVLALRAQSLGRAGADAEGARLVVVGVLALVSLSDIADGWIARRFDLTSQVGAVVDAVADKLVQVALVAFFSVSQGPTFATLPGWFILSLLGRDAVLGGGMLLARSRDVPLRVVHRWHGRVTSMTVFFLLGWVTFGLPRSAVLPLVIVSVAFVGVSGGAYLLNGINQAGVVLRDRREAAG